MVTQHFTLTSPAFVKGDCIPAVNTCEGSNISPFLAWHNPPGTAKSFVLIMDDPDARGGTFTHWLLFDIPPDIRELPCNDHEIGIVGRNDFDLKGYGGPCPPPKHGPHRYCFHLFAMDVDSLKVLPGAKRAEVEQAMNAHVVAEANLIGRFGRAGH